MYSPVDSAGSHTRICPYQIKNKNNNMNNQPKKKNTSSNPKRVRKRPTTQVSLRQRARAAEANSRPRANYGAIQVENAPVALGTIRRMGKAAMSTRANGDATVAHREYVRDFGGSVGFATSSLSINPGLVGTFPWLSSVARRYESYRFRKLKFCYETISPTSKGGTVAIVIDYDPSDSAPVDKTQALSYRSSVRCQPWENMAHNSEREDLNKRSSFLVRGGSVPDGSDVKFYDVGNMYQCTEGEADTSAIGELYVEYVVDLMTPQLSSGRGVGDAIWGSFLGNGTNAAPFATMTGNLPASVVSTGTTTSVSTFTFTQPWKGILSVGVVGTTLSDVAPTGTASTTQLFDVTNTAATIESTIFTVSAFAGQTVILTIANASISSSIAKFAQSDF